MQNWLICKCNDIMVRKAGIGHLLGTTALIKIASGKERSIEHLIRVFHARDRGITFSSTCGFVQTSMLIMTT